MINMCNSITKINLLSLISSLFPLQGETMYKLVRRYHNIYTCKLFVNDMLTSMLLENYNILSDAQIGFKAGYSTTMQFLFYTGQSAEVLLKGENYFADL